MISIIELISLLPKQAYTYIIISGLITSCLSDPVLHQKANIAAALLLLGTLVVVQYQVEIV